MRQMLTCTAHSYDQLKSQVRAELTFYVRDIGVIQMIITMLTNGIAATAIQRFIVRMEAEMVVATSVEVQQA